MSKGYWIVHVDIDDPEAFKAYAAANAPVLSQYGARFLARAGAFQAVEGAARARHTIVEFPSWQAAVDCWHSPAYQAARQMREGAATLDLLILEGIAP